MVGFGLSVGDFIAGVNTLINVIHSLSDTNGAQADYKELASELRSLATAIDGIKSLSPQSQQTPEYSELIAAVEKCKACVERFVHRNRKFKRLEKTPGKKWSLATLKKRGRGVQWAIWKKDDVEKFRGRVQAHTGAIGMLLGTLQVKQNDTYKALTQAIGAQVSNFGPQQLELKRGLTDQQDIMERVNLNVQGIIHRQASLVQSMEMQHTQIRDHQHSQARDLESAFTSQKSTTAQVGVDVQNANSQLQASLALLHSLVGGSTPFQEQQLQLMLEGTARSDKVIECLQQQTENLRTISAAIRDKEIPAQVPLSKPAVLHDARGRMCAFHLDFIDSADAFVAVLKVRFRDIGLRKIEKGQFVLEDTRRRHVISLNSWTTAVRPGLHIDMSMVFRQQQTSTGSCPGCGEKNEESEVEQIICGNPFCDMTYRRIVEDSNSAGEADPRRSNDPADRAPGNCAISNRDDSVDEEMHHYTRVQILAQLLLSERRQGLADASNDCCEDKNGLWSHFWVCHECHHLSNRIIKCDSCSHHRCAYCTWN